MFSKQKRGTTLDREQHELLEHAQKRIRQKKAVFQHFIIFLIGVVFFVVTNKILKIGEPHNWYVWAVMIWAFIWIVHLAQVFITNPLLSTEWERTQRERLLEKQKERIRKLEAEIAKEHPLPEIPPKEEL
ncbi:2TM domain-containing protein [Robiginitalea aurantiaca]|uniref:2TM domain-containing protein n=1 Tax=Robiginitalea aurantiaca TaxID=3056915 RepID=A0ABT7WC91_9FLAO|nr:2TM domain-containing protein [Robiginitalea aurantiaca]MDM9630518.1 2TM domain-containing protein [Robiginitalea aurantiaca]